MASQTPRERTPCSTSLAITFSASQQCAARAGSTHRPPITVRRRNRDCRGRSQVEPPRPMTRCSSVARHGFYQPRCPSNPTSRPRPETGCGMPCVACVTSVAASVGRSVVTATSMSTTRRTRLPAAGASMVGPSARSSRAGIGREGARGERSRAARGPRVAPLREPRLTAVCARRPGRRSPWRAPDAPPGSVALVRCPIPGNASKVVCT